MYVYVCMCGCMCGCMYVSLLHLTGPGAGQGLIPRYVWMYVCMYVWMYVCMCMCRYVYVYV